MRTLNIGESVEFNKAQSAFVRSIKRVTSSRIEVGLLDRKTNGVKIYPFKSFSEKKINAFVNASSKGSFFSYSIRGIERHQVKL